MALKMKRMDVWVDREEKIRTKLNTQLRKTEQTLHNMPLIMPSLQ